MKSRNFNETQVLALWLQRKDTKMPVVERQQILRENFDFMYYLQCNRFQRHRFIVDLIMMI